MIWRTRMTRCYISDGGHSALLRTFPFGSLNKCVSDFANAPSKFLASLGTSDMPKTLAEMLFDSNLNKYLMRRYDNHE